MGRMGFGKRSRILRSILHETKADKLICSYLIFIALSAAIIWIFEPTIKTYQAALWYCYAVISTAGFGDVVVTTLIPRLISVAITVYSALLIAIVTGVVVNYYTQMTEIKNKKTLTAFMDRLEQLPNLSKEELQELSTQVTEFRNRSKGESKGDFADHTEKSTAR